MSELVTKYHASGAYQIAQVYAFRDQSDEAFEWLDESGPLSEELAQRPAICRVLEEAQPADLKYVAIRAISEKREPSSSLMGPEAVLVDLKSFNF